MSKLLAFAKENSVRTTSPGDSLYLLSMTSVAQISLKRLQDQGPVYLLQQTGLALTPFPQAGFAPGQARFIYLLSFGREYSILPFHTWLWLPVQ